MKRFLFASIVFTTFLLLQSDARGGAPHKPLPVGKWKVEFSNRVVETVDVARNGEASVSEPLRRSKATPEISGESVVVFSFADDRVELWTRVGHRYVVEHWYPGKDYPSAPPVIGIADKVR